MTSRPVQPPVGAAGQVDRLLRLVPLLHGRDELRVADAAELLGVSAEQVVKDLKVLFMCGLPGGYPDDLIDVDLEALEGPHADGVIRVSNADYLDRPVRLAPVEAAALAVALHSIGAVDPGAREVVDRTLAKLESASRGPAPAVVVSSEPDLRHAWAGALAEAIRTDRQVRLEYWVATRDEVTERVVDPLRVDDEDGVRYLRAWCHQARDLRSFRLDRVIGLRVLEVPREVSDAQEDAERSFVSVTLLLDRPAAWFPRYYRVEEVSERADGTVEVTMRVWDLRWLDRVLLRLAPHVLQIRPSEVADRLQERTAEVLSLYSGPPASAPHPPSSPAHH